MERQNHWEQVYKTKPLEQVSWYQPTPETSLKYIAEAGLDLSAAIIDVGGGDSLLADHLLQAGFTDITVLDISQTALERAKKRLGAKAEKIHWIAADAAHWQPERSYDLWHDRAAFHFLTQPADIKRYRDTASQHIRPGGFLLLGTFSDKGPEKCSGLTVQRYGAGTLTRTWAKGFEKITCRTTDHATPSGSLQNFLFCLFQRNIQTP